jgi:OmpA-OmpF porin, OOP family
MRRHLDLRLASLAAVASCQMLLLSGTALGQPVQIFDDTPSIEQLRSIMIPESHGGTGRTIVLQHAGAPQKPDAMQLVNAPIPSTETIQSNQLQTLSTPIAEDKSALAASLPALRSPAAQAPGSQAKVVALANEVVTNETTHIHKPSSAAASAGAVGFHINFALDSAILPSASYDSINRIAELLKEEPQVKLRIEGHTDALGTEDYNLLLSKRRASAVAEYLVHRQGIGPDRLALVGKGMTEPMTEDPFDSRNRRVQFVRIE